MLPLMILCDFYCAWKYHRGCVWKLALRLLGGFIVGVGIATVLMMTIPGQQVWLKKVIGAVAIAFSLCYFGLLRDKRKIETVIPQGVWFGLVMGVLAGICSTLAHAAGPPVQMFLLSQVQTQDKQKHLGTISVYAMIGNLLKVPSYLASGAMTTSTLQITWPLALIVPVGLAVGVMIHNKLDNSKFNDVVNLLLIPIGLYLLVS
jgi:hypothetical protein